MNKPFRTESEIQNGISLEEAQEYRRLYPHMSFEEASKLKSGNYVYDVRRGRKIWVMKVTVKPVGSFCDVNEPCVLIEGVEDHTLAPTNIFHFNAIQG